jgi:hypothetical protein
LRQHLLTTNCNPDGAVKNMTAGSFLIWTTVSYCTNDDTVFELAQKSIRVLTDIDPILNKNIRFKEM